MGQKKEFCRYDFCCLLNEKKKNKEKYDKMVNDITELLGKDNIEKIEERRDLEPSHEVKNVVNGTYVTIIFNAERKTAKELNEKIVKVLQKQGNFLNRSLLINLTDEKKIKIRKIIQEKKKNVEQN